ncbi:MAG TPA: hypothetical protein VEL47_06155 [Myxococcota bacterium]|nr:hypothetical protein [Myxococcota bacterium]
MFLAELPQQIEASILAQYIPHSGPMVLLDRVEEWDENRILCISSTHQREAHPLRIDNFLSAIHTVEYAAQAASFHCALMSLKYHRPVEGIDRLGGISSAYLVVVRDFDFMDVDLAAVKEKLIIAAEHKESGPRLLKYDFNATTSSATLASGQITLVVER